jgi:O-antigen/teichoic acid export membrane protein
MRNNLIYNTIIYSIANLLSKIINFLMLPLYTYYLTISELGRFDLVINTITLLIPIITLHISEATYRYLVEEDNVKEKKKIITNAFIGLMTNIIIGYIFIFIVFRFYFSSIKALEIFLLFILSFSNILFTFSQQIVRGLKENKKFAFSGIINSLLLALMNVIFLVMLKLGYKGLLISNIISYILGSIYLHSTTSIIKYFNFKYIDFKIYRFLISYSIPLIPNLLSWWVINFSDRLLISYYLGLKENGIYAIANRFSTILFFMTMVFNLAWQESAILSFKDKDKDEYYTEVFNKYSKFLLSVVLLLLPTIAFIIRFLLDDSYIRALDVVPLLLYSVVFSSFSSFYGTAFQSSKNTKEAVFSSLGAGIVNILLNILFLPKIGVIGAGISTLFAFCFMWLIRIYQTRKYFNIKINIKEITYLIAINLIFIIIFYSYQTIYMEFTLFTCSFIIFFYFNRYMVNKFQKKIFEFL